MSNYVEEEEELDYDYLYEDPDIDESDPYQHGLVDGDDRIDTDAEGRYSDPIDDFGF